MANRPDNFSPTVTNVVPEEPNTASLTNMVLAVGDKLADASAQTKALQATAQTSAAFRGLDQKFRQQYADDPTNAQGLQDLQQARKDVVDKLGDGVPTLVMRDYTNKTIELGQQSDVSNELWTGRQQGRNAVNQLQTAQQSYYLQANTAGRQFAANGGGDINDALGFIQANASMQQFANPVLGADKTGAVLKNFNSNYVKSFVSGVAESHPQLAASLLQDDNIKQHFTTQDLGDMADLIKRTNRQQALTQSLQIVQNNSAVPDLVNNPNLSYFEKRAQLDQWDMQGAIGKDVAASARRYIKSSDDLDAQTDTPVMSGIISKIYDLNENTSLKQSDYLKGVNDIQEDIMNRQASGSLTGGDAQKLNKEMTTLTQKRVADATKAVGNHFGAVNKKFDTLPAEYRGQATRQLFNNSYGQNMSQQQLGNTADLIIDGINKQRRTDALGAIARSTNDDVFLQATGYSRDQVKQTAANRGISEAQVIQTLRDKYTKKRPQVRSVAPDQGDNNPSAGIQLDGPNPNAGDEEEGNEQ